MTTKLSSPLHLIQAQRTRFDTFFFFCCFVLYYPASLHSYKKDNTICLTMKHTSSHTCFIYENEFPRILNYWRTDKLKCILCVYMYSKMAQHGCLSSQLLRTVLVCIIIILNLALALLNIFSMRLSKVLSYEKYLRNGCSTRLEMMALSCSSIIENTV